MPNGMRGQCLAVSLGVQRQPSRGKKGLAMTIDTNIEESLKRKRPDIWHVPPEATVFEAIELMANKNIGALLVMERDMLLGVVSERDYTRKVALKGRSSKDTRVREILSTPLI